MLALHVTTGRIPSVMSLMMFHLTRHKRSLMALLRLYAAAENMCVISSLLSTCRNHDVNPREYLNDIISRMPYMEKASHEQLVELLPHKWKLIPHEPAVTLPTDGKPFVTEVYR